MRGEGLDLSVKFFSLVLGVTRALLRFLLRRGLSLLLADPEGDLSSRATLLKGLPELLTEEALGVSGRLEPGGDSSGTSSTGGAGFSASSACLPPPSGLLALLPVGMILSPGLTSLLLVDPTVRLGIALSLSSSSSCTASFSLVLGVVTGARTAAVGPGKSSGTMGRPLTRERVRGGVGGGRVLVGGGGGVFTGSLDGLGLGGPDTKSVWKGSEWKEAKLSSGSSPCCWLTPAWMGCLPLKRLADSPSSAAATTRPLVLGCSTAPPSDTVLTRTASSTCSTGMAGCCGRTDSSNSGEKPGVEGVVWKLEEETAALKREPSLCCCWPLKAGLKALTVWKRKFVLYYSTTYFWSYLRMAFEG